MVMKCHLVPGLSHVETVISQLGRTVFGEGSILYYLVLAGTALILLMAANTSYADFPRLAALQAGDGFLPRQLTYRVAESVGEIQLEHMTAGLPEICHVPCLTADPHDSRRIYAGTQEGPYLYDGKVC